MSLRFCTGLLGSVLALPLCADTGPEYLENEKEPDPLSVGFDLLKLPFEEERVNTLHLRTFYQDRTYEGAPDRQDWAGGGWLNAVGSFWDSRFKLAGTAYTSQKLYADDDKADTGALQPGHNSYSVLGEIYGSLALGSLALQAGRFELDLPYVNTHDIRMTPQTFQGGQVTYEILDDWTVGSAVLSEIKTRTRDGFNPLYKRAGLDEDENVVLGGSLYQPGPGNLAGIYAMHAPEFHYGVYLEMSRRFPLDEDRYVQLSAQYTRQESTGDEIGGEFSVDHYGARLSWKDGWYSGSLAYTEYPDEDRLRSPWGGIPGYTSVLISDFDQPEESAWLLGGTVKFDQFGARGLSINAKAVFGDTPDCGRSASPDRNEYNLNLKYAPPLKKLAGLVLQLRFGRVQSEDTCGVRDGIDITEVRFVANFPLQF